MRKAGKAGAGGPETGNRADAPGAD